MQISLPSLQQWQHLLAVSKKMLTLAMQSQWDELVENEVEYIQLVEALTQQTEPPTEPSQHFQVREILRQVIDNENEIKRLLKIRMDELRGLIQQGNQQQSLNTTYGNLSGNLLVPNPTTPAP